MPLSANVYAPAACVSRPSSSLRTVSTELFGNCFVRFSLQVIVKADQVGDLPQGQAIMLDGYSHMTLAMHWETVQVMDDIFAA